MRTFCCNLKVNDLRSASRNVTEPLDCSLDSLSEYHTWAVPMLRQLNNATLSDWGNYDSSPGAVSVSLIVLIVVKFVETALTLSLGAYATKDKANPLCLDCSDDSGFSAFLIAVPCGALAPTFLIGAAIGRLFGELAGIGVEELGEGGWNAAEAMLLAPTDFAAAGAAAFVGGVTGTVSIAVIVFEMTNQVRSSLMQ